MLKFKECPYCNIPCNIVSICSYDKDGSKLGGIFKCSKCGWFDFDNILTPEDIKRFKKKLDKLEVKNEN